MRLTIEPTAQCMRIDGVPYREWNGEDERGVPVKVWVGVVQPQTHDPALLEAFERELMALPELEPTAIDFRFLAD